MNFGPFKTFKWLIERQGRIYESESSEHSPTTYKSSWLLRCFGCSRLLSTIKKDEKWLLIKSGEAKEERVYCPQCFDQAKNDYAQIPFPNISDSLAKETFGDPSWSSKIKTED